MFAELLIAKKGLKIPVITSDHTSMGRDLGRKMNYIRHHLYGRADAITILTEKDRRLLGKKFGDKKHVVYNPLTFAPIAKLDTNARRKNILCVGRVNYWHVKGYDRMIQIWAKLWKKHPDWTLEIAGPASDESKSKLLEMAKQHGTGNIIFLGNVNDMRSLYQSSAILALPSRVEGFPMVLVEAMSQGVACVSFAMQGAIEEIITDGTDGHIIEDGDLESFSNALSELMKSESSRISIVQNAISSVARFSRQHFLDSWEKIINGLIHN